MIFLKRLFGHVLVPLALDKYERFSGIKVLGIVGSRTARVLVTDEFFHHAPKIPLIPPIFVSYTCPDSENK